jgi:hypothetical protein
VRLVDVSTIFDDVEFTRRCGGCRESGNEGKKCERGGARDGDLHRLWKKKVRKKTTSCGGGL